METSQDPKHFCSLFFAQYFPALRVVLYVNVGIPMRTFDISCLATLHEY